MMNSKLILLLCLATLARAQWSEPNCNGKQVIVHLFEWHYLAIADECENYLGPLGYCGVQISPPHEHILGDAWWTRYQPVSYILGSRNGDRDDFIEMVDRCNAVGVNIIVDLVLNHMTGDENAGVGTAGSSYDGTSMTYPIYSYLDFHSPCTINDYNNADEVRLCRLGTLNDLDQSSPYVQSQMNGYVNDMLSIGVKGFRVDAAKHMYPYDLEQLQNAWQNTNDGYEPFVFHEVIDMGGNEPIKKEDYTHLGKVTEFQTGQWLSCIKSNDLTCYNNYGLGGQGLLDGLHALTFIDNHDNQRGDGGGGDVLTYKDAYNYKIATAFNLAHDFGFKRVMSSYYFSDRDQGPPASAANENCFSDWVCEHRWSSIANLVRFANYAAGNAVTNYVNTGSYVAFSRGDVAFVAIGSGLSGGVSLYTGLPAGSYCDLVHDCSVCVSVDGSGYATVSPAVAGDDVVAIAVNETC